MTGNYLGVEVLYERGEAMFDDEGRVFLGLTATIYIS